MDVYNRLKDIYEEIWSIYRNLYNLETCGYKKSCLFAKRIELLKVKLEEENKLLNELVNSIDYDEIREEIFSYQGRDNFYFRMRDSLTLYESVNIEIYPEDDEELIKQKQDSMNICKIFNTSAKNIFLVYASFLQITIDKLVVKGLKDKLLRLKYYNCVTKRNMEKVMLQFDFDVPSEVYSDLNLVVDMLRMDDSFSLLFF